MVFLFISIPVFRNIMLTVRRYKFKNYNSYTQTSTHIYLFIYWFLSLFVAWFVALLVRFFISLWLCLLLSLFINVWIYVFMYLCVDAFVCLCLSINTQMWLCVFMEIWKYTKALCSLSVSFIIHRNIHAFLFSYAFRPNRQDAILSLHSSVRHGRVGREGSLTHSSNHRH